MSYYIGVDVGGTKVAYGLFDEEKNLVAKMKTPTRASLAVEDFFDVICSEIDILLDRESVLFSEVEGIGIGIPSFIDFNNGHVIKTGNLPQIRDFPLRDYLRKKLGGKVQIVVDNDGNIGALAEFRHGAGRGFEHMVFCLVSTGISSSLVINKSLFRGSYGWAGESGHMLVNPTDLQSFACGCNNTGCFNSICSGKMVMYHVKQWIKNGEETILVKLAGDVESINTEHLNLAYAELVGAVPLNNTLCHVPLDIGLPVAWFDTNNLLVLVESYISI
jgi:glucokinase